MIRLIYDHQFLYSFYIYKLFKKRDAFLVKFLVCSKIISLIHNNAILYFLAHLVSLYRLKLINKNLKKLLKNREPINYLLLLIDLVNLMKMIWLLLMIKMLKIIQPVLMESLKRKHKKYFMIIILVKSIFHSFYYKIHLRKLLIY